MSKLSLSGLNLNVTTILSIISKMEPALLAVPEVIDLIETAISVFSNEDKETVQNAYQAKMAQSDASHEDTQGVLDGKAAEGEPGEPPTS